MLKKFNKENASTFFEVGVLHNDSELIDQSWSAIRDDILEVVKTRGFFEKELVSVPESFDIEPIKNDRQLYQSFEVILKALEDEHQLKKRIGIALGLIQYLTSKAGLVLGKILEAKDIQLQCNVVWKPPPEGSLNKLNKIFNTDSCIKCKTFHNPLDVSNNCFGDAVKNIYLQYMHTNVNDYKIADVQTLYNELKDYVTV